MTGTPVWPTGWIGVWTAPDGKAVSIAVHGGRVAVCVRPSLGQAPYVSAELLDGGTKPIANLPAHTHTIAHTHAMDHTHGMGHTHDMTHGHTLSSNGDHHHTVAQSNDDGSNNNNMRRGAQKDRDVNTGNDGAHSHTVSTFAGSTGADSLGGVTGGSSRNPTGGSSAGDSGSTGSATPVTNMPPYAAVTFIIKT